MYSPFAYSHSARNSFGPALALALLFCGLSTDVLAQSSTVRGFVTSRADGQPLPGVNVVLIDAGENLFGAATDSDGFYAIRVSPGTYQIRATFIGFETFADTIQVAAGQILARNIAMVEVQTELDEVVVETQRETAGAANISAGLQTVRPSDVELVPAPDISADLVNYLTVLPGVVSTGDRGGQLFVRGGEPTQNLVLLDGIPIYQPFHIVGFFSAFPSEIITTADVYAGGFGVRYGGRLSSVIDIAARPGNKRRFAGAVTAAPFVSSLRLEGPLYPGHVSVLASVRESVIKHGAAKIIDEPLPFSFGDAFAKVHANLGPSSQLSITAMSTHDAGELGVDPLEVDEPDDGFLSEIVRDEVRWVNEALGGRFIVLPATLPILSEILVSYSRLNNTFGPRGNPLRSTSIERFGASANVTHYLRKFSFNWGIFVNSSTLDSDLGGKFQNLVIENEFVTEAGAYIEPEIRAGGLTVQPGLRLHSFPSKGLTFLEPRLRLTMERGINRFSAAAGLYHQQIVGINDRRDAGDIFTAWTASPFGLVPEAIHLIAGWRVAPTDGFAVSIEGYYKSLRDIAIAEWTAFPRFTTRLQKSNGQVYGLDARTELTLGAFYVALTYGLAKVDYEASIPALQFVSGEETTTFNPPHDRRHQVNAITSLTQWGFDFNVRWQLSSGLPFNESLGFDRFILLDSLVNVRTEPGDERVLYRTPYTGRLPFYHRLDLSVDRTFPIKGRTSLTVQAGVINVYDRRNLFYLDLFTLRRVDQLPIIPTLGLKLDLE